MLLRYLDKLSNLVAMPRRFWLTAYGSFCLRSHSMHQAHIQLYSGLSAAQSGAALTAVLRQIMSTRRDYTMPFRLRGVTVHRLAKAAWAALCASKSSFLPRRLRSCLSGAVTSRTPRSRFAYILKGLPVHSITIRCSSPNDRIQISISL